MPPQLFISRPGERFGGPTGPQVERAREREREPNAEGRPAGSSAAGQCCLSKLARLAQSFVRSARANHLRAVSQFAAGRD